MWSGIDRSSSDIIWKSYDKIVMRLEVLWRLHKQLAYCFSAIDKRVEILWNNWVSSISIKMCRKCWRRVATWLTDRLGSFSFASDKFPQIRYCFLLLPNCSQAYHCTASQALPNCFGNPLTVLPVAIITTVLRDVESLQGFLTAWERNPLSREGMTPGTCRRAWAYVEMPIASSSATCQGVRWQVSFSTGRGDDAERCRPKVSLTLWLRRWGIVWHAGTARIPKCSLIMCSNAQTRNTYAVAG